MYSVVLRASLTDVRSRRGEEQSPPNISTSAVSTPSVFVSLEKSFELLDSLRFGFVDRGLPLSS